MIEVLNPLTISNWMRLQVTRSRKVGNALKGATFISTTAGKADGSYRNVLCQCPEWGDLHFHAVGLAEKAISCGVCQCPEWGDLHFHYYYTIDIADT